MSPVTLGLWLAGFSALTTALAHASIKSGQDKLAVQAWVRLVGLTIATPLAIWTGLPPDYLWPWLIAAAATHAVYQAVLSFSYSVSDFSVAYPIARGSAPILTAVMGVLLLGDTLGPWLVGAIAVVSTGIVMLAAGGRVSRHGLLLAVATGMLTTVYSVIDARGMRLSPDLLTFIAWFFVLDAVAMPLLFAVLRRGAAPAAFRADWKPGLSAAIMAPVSFVPALYAFALAPVGAVSAIREASVLVGMLVAGRVLGERVDARRLIGAALITAGIAGIVAASAH
ncbi:DMT family transporter [Sphingomonas sp. SUN039]|uniref:DMT family transporter n=1 Tax=Sphingomonas sp. SUN039 TaxID=2937787 RepID=UPI0021647612|nr:DMT family transporter [Sphingomonas sp. SUN039]UVO55144.1 DMT family transporter [Sphingomonas sp. SUN039]